MNGLDDFSRCMVTNSRTAARAITRRYDASLRQLNISSTQLSLLAALRDAPGRTVSELAEARVFERTTLTRNLDRLETLGLITSKRAAHGNGRICAVTASGTALMERALPIWRQAQFDLRKELSADGFDDAIAVLQRLAAV